MWATGTTSPTASRPRDCSPASCWTPVTLPLHTGVRTFEAAAALRRYGAETEHVRQLFDVSMVEYTTKARLVSEAQMYRGCAITVSGEVAPEARVAIAQAANDLLTIQNVEASFVAVQVGGGVNISARSLGAVNVQVIMESLGGGGHQTMAAAQLKHITPEAARQPHPRRPSTSTGRPRKRAASSRNPNRRKRINSDETVRLSYRWRWPVRRGICP